MAKIKCTACNKEVKKWNYEIKSLVLETYKCKECKQANGRVEKTCPICEKTFSGIKSQIKKQITCSYACSNKYFRTGRNNGNWNEDRYRTTCFEHHEKKCIVCGEDKIVAVHHYDHNHNNNSIDNLVPLCPTHHQYIHSQYRDEIVNIVENYVNKIKGGE